MGVTKAHLPLPKRTVGEPGAQSGAPGHLHGHPVASPDQQWELLPAKGASDEHRRAAGANEGQRPESSELPESLSVSGDDNAERA